eukprot:gene17741-23338_t
MLPLDELVFGKSFSDHMLSIDWDEINGWQNPTITPYHNFSISPAATVFHYAIECFEGMKAYKDKSGVIRLFRPDCNMDRLLYSMQRLAMPKFNADGFIDCIKQLLLVDKNWIPDQEGYSIYIRPTAIGTSPYLGVHASETVKLYVILSPVGPYYKHGFKPIKLFADTANIRAWPGGVGNAKVGGNYAPTILPSKLVAERGYSQILWLFGENHEITEVGAMNIFFLIKKSDSNILELITPPLSRGDILPGVTRRSIIDIAKSWTGDESIQVSERSITMSEVKSAQLDGRLLEVFGCGTAVVISPVKAIHYNDEDINVPTGDDVGPIAYKLWKTLYDIQYGKLEHPWSVRVN